MSPEAIHSLIELFGVEKGLHILNLFTAMDDTELTQQHKRKKTVSKDAQAILQELDLASKVSLK
ncbi:MAG: hypothetical protein O2954_15215 [bacterium]|nr:hypothetical protein [bacterium]